MVMLGSNIGANGVKPRLRPQKDDPDMSNPTPNKVTSVTVAVPPELLSTLDDWRAQQDALPSRASVLRAALHAFLVVRQPGHGTLTELASELQDELAELAEVTAAELMTDEDEPPTGEELTELAELAESADVAMCDRADEMRDELTELASALQGTGLVELANDLANDLHSCAEYEGEALRDSVPSLDDLADEEASA